jgi:hypothetical protein
VKAGKMIVARFMLCGAIIGPSASPASPRPGHLCMRSMPGTQPCGNGRRRVRRSFAALGSSPTDRGDSEPPHPAEFDQTVPGSAPTYSGTASATGVINGLPQLSTLPYSGAVPTSLVTGAVPRNWAQLTMGRDHTLVLGLPEHARLGQLPPMIYMPARYQPGQCTRLEGDTLRRLGSEETGP